MPYFTFKALVEKLQKADKILGHGSKARRDKKAIAWGHLAVVLKNYSEMCQQNYELMAKEQIENMKI